MRRQRQFKNLMQGQMKDYVLIFGTLILIIVSFWLYFKSKPIFNPHPTSKRSSLVSQTAKEKAEAALRLLETQKNEDNIKKAQDLINQVQDGQTRKRLQKRLDDFKIAMVLDQQITSAEEAVKQLETTQTEENVQKAQDLVDKVKKQEAKAALQKRIDAVKAALAVQTQQTTTLAADSQEVAETPQYQAPVERYEVVPQSPSVPAQPSVVPEMQAPAPADSGQPVDDVAPAEATE